MRKKTELLHVARLLFAIGFLCAPVAVAFLARAPDRTVVGVRPEPDTRREVIFWHFWGGDDGVVVDGIIERFNASQQVFRVRGVAMPGNNLDMKVFLAVAGNDPPDLINQDDPILADWRSRGAVTPLHEIATEQERRALDAHLFPTARALSKIDGRYWSVCNGLDIRALYVNTTLLEEEGLDVPKTLAQLDHAAIALSRRDALGRLERAGFIPDPRRYWAWATVFGVPLFDAGTNRFDLTSPRSLETLRWMQSYRDFFGARSIATFRQADQSLPGKTFPLLARRYAMIMDGQWRVRDIAAFQAEQRRQNRPLDAFAVTPLPPPAGGEERAGWLNGNYFLIPHGARDGDGAWEFIRFWIGMEGHHDEAAHTCAAGGWIPVSPKVVQSPIYQRYLASQPLMRTFVDLAGSPAQKPLPAVRQGNFVKRKLESLGSLLLTAPDPPPVAVLAEDIEEEINQAVLRDAEAATP